MYNYSYLVSNKIEITRSIHKSTAICSSLLLHSPPLFVAIALSRKQNSMNVVPCVHWNLHHISDKLVHKTHTFLRTFTRFKCAWSNETMTWNLPVKRVPHLSNITLKNFATKSHAKRCKRVLRRLCEAPKLWTVPLQYLKCNPNEWFCWVQPQWSLYSAVYFDKKASNPFKPLPGPAFCYSLEFC